MSHSSTQIAGGKATTIKKTFSRQTSIQTAIKADRAAIWALLTDAANYPKWNSTVISIEGKIALGETIRLISKLAPTRTFKLKIKQFEPNARMTWGDAMGNRTYELSEQGNGIVQFSMAEKIGGPIFPLFAKLIPPFDESFETFAADLKKAAESLESVRKGV
jgi:uncharacterized protein YndB with AHSA1/START domain